MKDGTTCVIPAHNEGGGIAKLILEIDRSIPLMARPFTIYVSEDGSSDNTREQVLEISNHVKNCEVILSKSSERLGYSKAVQIGIQECRTKYICFMDADGQCDPSEMGLLFDKLPGSGIVVGFRNPRVDGFNRIVYSKLFGYVYRLLGGPKLIDPSSPFVFAKTSEISFISVQNFHLSYGFWWEFQQRIAARNLKVIEVPVSHRSRAAGETQVYTVKRLPLIIKSHLIGLWKLKKELQKQKM
jgi:glycosyltransferase involved in cell wall biosynthesis